MRYFHTKAGDAKEFVDSLKTYNDKRDNIYRDIKIIDTSRIGQEGENEISDPQSTFTVHCTFCGHSQPWTFIPDDECPDIEAVFRKGRAYECERCRCDVGISEALADEPVTTTSDTTDNSTNETPPAAAINDAHRRYFDDKDILINSPGDAAQVFRELLQSEDAIDRDKEHFYVMHLDVRNKVKMVEVVSVGTLSASYVHPRETFRRAIVEGSSSIIVAHNHPSGEVSPSDEDTNITKLLHEAGAVVNIQLLDHIIFSTQKAFSFKENKEISGDTTQAPSNS